MADFRDADFIELELDSLRVSDDEERRLVDQ